MKKLLCICLVLGASLNAYCQQAQFIKQFSSTGISGELTFTAMQIDLNGNIVLGGYFRDTIDADPGPGSYMLQSIGSSDVFIIKLNPNGQFLWAGSMGSGSSEYLQDLSIDNQGKIYATGIFHDSLDLDPGPGIIEVSGHQADDIFVTCLQPTGQYAWGNAIGDTDYDGAFGIATDNQGNCYVTGQFKGTVDFDAGIGQTNLTAFGSADIFVAKYGGSGNLIWVKPMGGTGGESGAAITIDPWGYIYTTGIFTGVADFDPSPNAVFTLTAPPASQFGDLFVSKLSASGEFVWAIGMGGPDSIAAEIGNKIVTDASGACYISGAYDEVVDFDPDPNVTHSLNSQKFPGTFLLKLDSAGSFESVLDLQATSDKSIADFVISPTHEIYAVGSFRDSLDLDPGVGESWVIASSTVSGFVIHLAANGSFIGGYPIVGDYTGVSHAALDALGTPYLAGVFKSIVDFDPGPGSNTLTSTGTDGFLLGGVAIAIDVPDLTETNSIAIFPVPAGDFVIAQVPEALKSKSLVIEVFDLSGHLLHSQIAKSGCDNYIDLHGLPAGVYDLRVMYGLSVISRKILKQ